MLTTRAKAIMKLFGDDVVSKAVFDLCVKGVIRKEWFRWLSLPILAWVLASAASAEIPLSDKPGSSDDPLLKRYAGSVIVGYDQLSREEVVLPTGKLELGSTGPVRAPVAKTIEGRHTHFLYYVGKETSPLEVMRSYQKEILSQGGRVLFECKEEACGALAYGNSMASPPGMLEFLYPFRRAEKLAKEPNPDYCAMTSQIERLQYSTVELGGGRGFAAIAAYKSQGNGYCEYVIGATFVSIELVDTSPRQSRMVTVSSAEIASALQGSGKIALYGIYFDVDKTELKPESDATLKEIAKLLKEKPGLKLLVVGHTDNQGTLAFNTDLSQRRAASVVGALASQYGIKQDRLTPLGVSYAAPVASNKTEEGRAKNRRVELVEQ